MTSPNRKSPESLPPYARLTASVLFPLMNRATKRTIHQKLRFLDQSQWWSRDQLVAYQNEKLRALINHAYQNVPYYRRLMEERSLHPDDCTSVDFLKQLPVVSKSELKANPADFQTKGSRLEEFVPGTTSGSTGQPTRFYRTLEQDSWHWALKYRMWGMAGYRLGIPYVNLYNMQRSGLRKRLQDKLLRNQAFYVFESENQTQVLADAAEAIDRRRIEYVAGCTSTLVLLADYYQAISRRPSSLRAVLSTGSVLTIEERTRMEGIFDAPLWDHYGLGGEGAHVAAECEQHAGYHVNVENMIVEPEDPALVDTDTASRIFVTVLDNWGWPLIRYDTGDYAVFSTRTCPCGRGLPMLERVDGRVSDVITLPSGNRVNVHYFSVILGRSKQIVQYQAEQKAADRLTLRIVWSGTPEESEKDRIRSALAKSGGPELAVTFEDVDQIPLTRSGKYRYVIAYSGEPTETASV